jgi:peptidoglycan/LPS O-acetylase OafA/YrhL
MFPGEYGAHTHAMFWIGVALTPLLLQGWIPSIATFLNTPAWTMSAESSYYGVFPWLASWKRPVAFMPHLLKMAGIWFLGMLPGALYILFNPDGIAHPDRWSYGPWLQALKYTPYTHFASFIFGVMLANLDEMIPRRSQLRLWLGLAGFAGLFGLLELGPIVPYALIHDGLLMPLFGCIVLGLAGQNLLSSGFGLPPLVFVGEASYCLYLLHFSLWNLIHDSHVLNWLHLDKYDPWISYVTLIGLALLALHLVEKPAQKLLRRWMDAGTVVKERKRELVSADRDGP